MTAATDHAATWDALTPAQRLALVTGHIRGTLGHPRRSTVRVLRRERLVETPARRLTPHGTQLATWALRTGRWS